MTTTRKRLLAAALGTASLVCAPIVWLGTTAAAAPVAAGNTADVRAASNCWQGVHGVTCVSRDHRSLRACDYARHQKRAAGYSTGSCYWTSDAWGPYYFLYSDR
jgi:hypothetical protein